MLLYIHIPFCKRICSYCDFYHTTCFEKYQLYISKLISDIRSISHQKQIIETIYLGGGTPSVLSITDLKEIFRAINESFDTSFVREITMECNPDDMTEQYCKLLKEIGINRLSIGIQSFNDLHLKIMNRRHNSKEAIQAVQNAQRTGFKNISIDLIYGLPFMSEKEWQYNLDTINNLGIQHISAYHLTIEDGTIFAKKHIEPVTDDISELHYRMLQENLSTNGFLQYEISNFAKEGYQSIHNSGYWTGKEYLGLGPSAHSFDGNRHRWWQPSDIEKWLQGKDVGNEYLTDEEREEEIIMTSLRTVKGLQTENAELIDKSKSYINHGIMQYKDSWLSILPEHFLISDYIISELI